MPAEVQITELAVTPAITERRCAGMAAERHWRHQHGEFLVKPVQPRRAGTRVGLTAPRGPPPSRTGTMHRDTHVEEHLWHAGITVARLH